MDKQLGMDKQSYLAAQNPDANANDGSCDFTSCLVFGCNDTSACNYNPEADLNDGTCAYPDDSCEECGADGTVLLFDMDGDGVCDYDETEGCTMEEACNYNPY